MKNALAGKLTSLLFRDIHYDFWNVGLIKGGVNQLLSGSQYNIRWYKHRTSASYIADPFIIRRENNDFVFVEEFDYATNKGHISVIYDWNKPPVKIIDEPYHLSYPFLIEEDGTLYMIPEASAGGKIYYYTCQKFPFEWRKEGVLIDEAILDPTIFKSNGKYWMFYTKPAQSCSELHLRYSDTLLGVWMEHSGNPVKVVPKICRPAGPIFEVNNALYRPSQDSTGNYGDNIIINRITELSTSTYREEQVNVITPMNEHPYTGMHHIAHTPGMLVIDGRKNLKEFKGIGSIVKAVMRKFS
jgi:hypothetical protein